MRFFILLAESVFILIKKNSVIKSHEKVKKSCDDVDRLARDNSLGKKN